MSAAMDRDTKRVILTGDLTTRGTPRIRAPKQPRPKVSIDGLIGQAIRGAMDRMFKAGADPNDLTPAIDAMVARANGRCEVTGIPFSDQSVGGARRRPWVPTVDRIDAAKGYEPGNIRLVCCAANIALNDWGDDVFNQMVDAAYRKRHA